VLATNTSSIDIDAIADDVADPERVLGLHFFNPPPVMALVEVVHGKRTAQAYVEHATALMEAWGKAPVRCSSTPGFIVNRVARPFYGEAQRIVEAGTADAATVDWILREKGGFPMGPLELTDFIGQDVNLAVGTSVWEQTDHDERYAPTAFQRELVAAGRLGRKSGRGVYTYAADGAVEGAAPDLELAERLVGGPVETDPLARTLAMLVNEAVDLVARGEASAEDVDTAMRLGTRYPRGPIEWGREIGFDTVAAQLAQLDAAFPGGRYRPSPALTDGSLS
jgi:3-hydroxybutyryl-CoA dehydrogenase